jgi:rubrerythrin
MKEHEKQAIEEMTEVIEHLERLTRDVVGARPSPKMYAQELYRKGWRKQSNVGAANFATPTGKWEKRVFIIFDSEKDCYRCSVCNTTWDTPTRYCPYCGAKMEGGSK